MKITIPCRLRRITIILVCLSFFCACIFNRNVSGNIPGDADKIQDAVKIIKIESITETMDGIGAVYLPDWLTAYITGGIAKAEELNLYSNKYLFIGNSSGSNFIALSKWADNFTVVHDFPRLAAARIEKRMIYSGALYPDDEYGFFFERLIKKAFVADYPGAIKEETYWIKTLNNNVNEDMDADDANDANNYREIYDFFVFISIDKTAMQVIIKNMMAEVFAAVTPTRAQTSSIIRLQQNFFEGF